MSQRFPPLQRLSDEETELSAFEKLVPDEIWEMLAQVVNENLVKGAQGSSRKKDTSSSELKRWFGIWLQVENTWGNDSKEIRDHFLSVKSECGGCKGLGADRFTYLLNAIQPSVAELTKTADLLSKAAQSVVEDVHLLTLDETVIGYQPTKAAKERAEERGEPIPVVYIPRKPHPNGLEVMTVATFVYDPTKRKEVPFVVMLHPHLASGDNILGEVVAKVFGELDQKWGSHPHWVFDAGFGSEKTVQMIMSKGGIVTCSVPSHQISGLWDALECELPTERWRAAGHAGLVASCHVGMEKTRG